MPKSKKRSPESYVAQRLRDRAARILGRKGTTADERKLAYDLIVLTNERRRLLRVYNALSVYQDAALDLRTAWDLRDV